MPSYPNGRSSINASRWVRVIAAIVVILVGSVGAGGISTANADSAKAEQARASVVIDRMSKSKDPVAVYAALTLGEKTLADKALNIAKAVEYSFGLEQARSVSGPTAAFGGLAPGCWTWTNVWVGQNAFGVDLIKWYQRVDWCINGFTITEVRNATNWGTVHYPLWEYVGVQSSWNAGGAGSSYFERFGQGHFQSTCTPWVGCLQHTYPWHDTTVTGDGGYSNSSG